MAQGTISGFGGIVLFADHADSLTEWYREHFDLHFQREPDTHAWRSTIGQVGFAIIQARAPRGTSRRQVEISWLVDDMDAVLERLAEHGVAIDERQETAVGDFAWLDDPERNRLELCQRL